MCCVAYVTKQGAIFDWFYKLRLEFLTVQAKIASLTSCEPPRPRWFTAIMVVHREINFLIMQRLTPQFATAKLPCSTMYCGEIVIVHSGLNHGDAMAEIGLDVV
ncbi:hypothetical protein DPMN_137006 [Dreissena polymorpha]|uniref:Uncharacterized protein n=1 Tax=Dreissena polymorpha TaxID=45954 RepID=A0A9D4G3X8_DREPO|nr:hypothetical protein DPMN_137006 [Dreissena polymorpha]